MDTRIKPILDKKILMNWEPGLEKIPEPVEQHPTCRGVAYGAKSHYERCLMPANWWHPMSASYCHSHISQGKKDEIIKLWRKTRLIEVLGLLPKIGVCI